MTLTQYFYKVTIHTLPHLKCIRLLSVRSSRPCINIGVRIELTIFRVKNNPYFEWDVLHLCFICFGIFSAKE